MIAFPRRHLSSLHELASQVLARRGVESTPATLARELLVGFFDVCMRTGQDGVLAALAQTFASLDLDDPAALADEPRLADRLAATLGDRSRFDPRGPRSALPTKLADALIAALTLELEDAPGRSVTLSDELRQETMAALTGVVDGELAAAQLRPAIIAAARARCEERHVKAFDKMVAQLDERGVRLPPQPKVPLDVVRAVQQALLEARTEIVRRVANTAIDRARAVLERASPEAAARIDLPISHRLTPRDVAVRRAAEGQVPAPEQVVRTLFATLTELLELAWTAVEVPVRPYGASQTFAVGEVIEHPKFGRGTVQVVTVKNIEVEFPDGAITLVHARGGK